MSTDPNELEDLEPETADAIKGGTGWKDRRPTEGMPDIASDTGMQSHDMQSHS